MLLQTIAKRTRPERNRRVATVRVKDIALPIYCPHIIQPYSVELRTKLWEQFRGRAIQIDVTSFRRGLCALCDCWEMLGEPAREIASFWRSRDGRSPTPEYPIVISRAELELGD